MTCPHVHPELQKAKWTETIPASKKLAILSWFFATLTILAFLLIVAVSTFHHVVYRPHIPNFLDSLEWTSERIDDEETYYYRGCDASTDVTTDSLQDLMIDPTTRGLSPKTWLLDNTELLNEAGQVVSDPVDIVMEHGFGMLPSVLSNSTAKALREYILKENAAITNKEEMFYVHNPENRWSLLLDVNADPAIGDALKEIALHPVLKPLLETLLGDDPALLDICSITSAAGATAQNWHPDTSFTSSALSHGRSFLPVYSVFIPLQDTVEEMGPTGICPGSHMCIAYEESPHCGDVSLKALANAGDALIMNSQSVHRGSEFFGSEDRFPHRVAFMVGFAVRPRPSVDGRLLPLGTTFSTQWDLWGHTWGDMVSIWKQRWSFLQSLGLRKVGRHWGWNLWFIRFLCYMNGSCIVRWFDNWEVSDFESILRKVVLVAGIVYGTLLLATSGLVLYLSIQWKKRRINSNLSTKIQKRVRQGHAFVLLFIGVYAAMFWSSEWAILNRRSNRFYAPKFPSISHFSDADMERSVYPLSGDVLIGDRLYGRNMFAYNQYLQFHPGNRRLRLLVMGQTSMYTRATPWIVKRHIIQTTLTFLRERNAQFLQQDEYGFYELLNQYETKYDLVREMYIKRSNRVVQAIVEEIESLCGDAKYEGGATRIAFSHTCRHLDSLKMKVYDLDEGTTFDDVLRSKRAICDPSQVASPSEMLGPNRKQYKCSGTSSRNFRIRGMATNPS